MLLLHTALPFEAHPLISHFRLSQVASPAGSRLYMDAGKSLGLIVGGIGADATQKRLGSTAQWFHKADLKPRTLVSFGIAAASRRVVEVGATFQIEQINCPDHAQNRTVGSIFTTLETRRLLTVNEPVTDPNKLHMLAGDDGFWLVDMEGYYWVACCEALFDLQFGQIGLVKIVSDFADAQTPNWKSFASLYDRAVQSVIPSLEAMAC